MGRAEAARAARQVEDGGGGGGAGALVARGGAAQADHRHPQGYARSARGASLRFPQHRHQGFRASDAVSGLHED